jgi:hypothetical protein
MIPADECLRPPEQAADSVQRFPARDALASLDFLVLADADAEAPGRLPDRSASLLPIVLEHPGQRRHG